MTNRDLEFHAFCLTDTGWRLDRFAAAIAARIRPGDTVVDLGAGSGILSFLACRAGARRVYAIEAGGSIAFARLLAARNGFQDRIEFIAQPSTQVTLPERVDMVLGDIHDTFGLQAQGLATIADARDRFLAPGGTLIPCRLQLLTAPVEAPDHYRRTIDVWRQQARGIDLSPLRSLAVNQPTAARIARSQLLGEVVPLASIDLTQVTRLHTGGATHSDVMRDGALHGVCGCFVTTLADGVTMSNVPGESETTNFAQAFFPVEAPISVRTGDRVAIRLETHDGAAARWQIEVTRKGDCIGRFDHSMLHAETLSIETLRKHADDYRPALTTLGALERELLDRFDGTHSAAALESWLTTRAGAVLPSAQEASAFLKRTIDRCG